MKFWIILLITLGITNGILVVIWQILTHKSHGTVKPIKLGWYALGFSVAALVLTIAGFLGLLSEANLGLGEIPGLIGLILSIVAVILRDRRWPTWVGLIISANIIAFWIAFIIFIVTY